MTSWVELRSRFQVEEQGPSASCFSVAGQPRPLFCVLAVLFSLFSIPW